MVMQTRSGVSQVFGCAVRWVLERPFGQRAMVLLLVVVAVWLRR
jgi:hypothetical protein